MKQLLGAVFAVALCVMACGGQVDARGASALSDGETAGAGGSTPVEVTAGQAGSAGAEVGGVPTPPTQTCVGAVMTIICDGIENEHPDCDGRKGLIRRYCDGTRYVSEFVPAEGAGGAGGAAGAGG